jgi:hypothetical protein
VREQEPEFVAMCQPRVRTVAAAALLGVLAAAPVRADLIELNFQDINVQNGTTFVPGPYLGQGFTLSSTGGFNAYGPQSGANFKGQTGLSPLPGSAVRLARTDGGSFSLLSIDLAPVGGGAIAPVNPTVTFTGTLAGGGTVSNTFTVTTPAGTQAFQKFDFTGFDGLTRVDWSQPSIPLPQGQGLHQFTNIDLQTPSAVPEPSSLVLGGTAAFVGLFLVRPRRNQTRKG